jgi:hypothetical protein
MAKIDPVDHPTMGYGDVKHAVHRDGDRNIWYCEEHTFVGNKDVCERCGQDTSHPVHDVRAYGILVTTETPKT